MARYSLTNSLLSACLSVTVAAMALAACNTQVETRDLRTKLGSKSSNDQVVEQRDQSSADAASNKIISVPKVVASGPENNSATNEATNVEIGDPAAVDTAGIVVDGSAPRLTAQSLTGDHSYGVALDVVLTLSFDKALDPESIKGSIVVRAKDGTPQAIVTTQKKNGFLEIVPQKLAAGTTYTLAILKTLKDTGGNAIEKSIELQFTTALAIQPSGGDAMEDHVCLINVSGQVLCRGDNALGQLGTSDLAVPVKLPAKAVRVATSATGSCALLESGVVHCWGQGNASPSEKAGLANIVSLSAHSNGFCSLSSVGKVQCWGENQLGQLGNGQTTASSEPVVPTGLESRVLALGTGPSHSCAVHAVNGLYCWGANSQGQLGIGTTKNAATPTLVSDFKLAPESVRQIDGGLGHSCLVTKSSEVYCWGDNLLSQLSLANEKSALKPVKIDPLGQDVQSIDIGHSHSCATTTTGAVKCWGWNLFSQLGNGGTTNAATPVEVLPATNKTQFVISSHFFTMAVSSDGLMKMWGLTEDLVPSSPSSSLPVNYSI